MSDTSWLSSVHNFCLQPHICNDNRLRQASEKCLLLYDSSCHVNVHKGNHSIVIPKSNYCNKCKNQTKTKPELKWWKSRALLHNVKHTQKATSSAKLSCSSPSQERSDFNSFFPPPKRKRGELWSEIFQSVSLTKKAAFLLIIFAILFQTHIGKAKRNHQLKQPALLRLVRKSSLFKRAVQMVSKKIVPIWQMVQFSKENFCP